MNADVIIIGSGPAGIQAAIHSSRKKATTVLVGKPTNSALANAHIENYFGVKGTVIGIDLLTTGIEQAKSFGCKVLEQNVTDTSVEGDLFKVVIESGEEIIARSVILATGISRVKLNVKGEKEFFGKGVSYCSSCDCNFFKGVPVAIVGNESEAAVSAAMMTEYASEVYWITEDPDVDPALKEKVTNSGAIILQSSLTEIKGTDKVNSILLKSGEKVSVEGVFIELGGRSSENIAMDLGVFPEMDNTIIVNPECETSVKGVFACGDLSGKPWQLAKAVGQGAIAGANAADYSKGNK
jgi:Thioredoxin reductase